MNTLHVSQIPFNSNYRAIVQIAGRLFEANGETKLEAVQNLLLAVHETQEAQAISYSADLDEILAMGRESLLEGSAATIAKVDDGWFGIALRGGVTAAFLAIWFKGVRELQAEVDKMEQVDGPPDPVSPPEKDEQEDPGNGRSVDEVEGMQLAIKLIEELEEIAAKKWPEGLEAYKPLSDGWLDMTGEKDPDYTVRALVRIADGALHCGGDPRGTIIPNALEIMSKDSDWMDAQAFSLGYALGGYEDENDGILSSDWINAAKSLEGWSSLQ